MWYSKAGEQGNASAFYYLSTIFLKRGNVGVAHATANIAAALATSKSEQEKFAKLRDDVAGLMSPSQLDEAVKTARKLQEGIRKQ